MQLCISTTVLIFSGSLRQVRAALLWWPEAIESRISFIHLPCVWWQQCRQRDLRLMAAMLDAADGFFAPVNGMFWCENRRRCCLVYKMFLLILLQCAADSSQTCILQILAHLQRLPTKSDWPQIALCIQCQSCLLALPYSESYRGNRLIKQWKKQCTDQKKETERDGDMFSGNACRALCSALLLPSFVNLFVLGVPAWIFS